jgi:chitin synthase
MSPLELEVYHQMRNVIGIDPAFYEYIFTVDADLLTASAMDQLDGAQSMRACVVA